MKITQLRAIEKRVQQTQSFPVMESYSVIAGAIGVSTSAVSKVAAAMGHRRQAIKRLKFKVRLQQALLGQRERA